jgi:hypothetical protein
VDKEIFAIRGSGKAVLTYLDYLEAQVYEDEEEDENEDEDEVGLPPSPIFHLPSVIVF